MDSDQYWFEIPRNCSTTIKNEFPQKEMIFRSDQRYFDATRDHKPLAVFSDPIERFVSTLNVYFTEDNKYTEYGKDIFASIGYDMAALSAKERVDLILQNLDAIQSKHQKHHFDTQCSYLDRENFSDFEVVKKSDVSQRLGIKDIHNKTNKQITIDDLNKQQIEFIKDMYKEDYDFLKERAIL